MNGRLLVIFASQHGYVRRYVDILGNALGCDAVPADKLRADMLGAYDRFVFIGSMRGATLNGFKRVVPFMDRLYGKLAVCGVGMLPFDRQTLSDILDGNVSVVYEKFIPVFYAQGGFDMDELTRLEKMSIAMTVRNIRAQSVISDKGTFVLNAAQQPVDNVKRENIQPLIDYLEGKAVDEQKYLPAEIDDPEEMKRYMAELEKSADAAPVDKKRELKKKLKG